MSAKLNLVLPDSTLLTEAETVRNRLLVFTVCLWVGSLVHSAEPTAVEKATAKKIADFVSNAGTQFQAGEFDAAGESITAAMDAIEAAMPTASPALYDAIQPAFSRISKASALLELEGVLVRPFSPPSRPEATKPTPSTTPSRTPKPAPNNPLKTPLPPVANPLSAAMEPISFVKTVAPILVQHCGRCHIQGARGNFSMATFADLAKGPPEGTVIFPGDVAASRLIQTIETGDMPRGGGQVPPDQLKSLKDWIAAGAKYDGPSPEAPLTSFATASPAPTMPAPAPAPVVRRATGSETVSFSKDIAPILLKNCNGCHIDAMQTRGGLRMDTFAQLLRGGDSGAIVEGGKSAGSLLIRKLKGEEGQRMPAGGRPPLSEETITLISRWIDEGATLDGESETQPLSVMSALAWAKNASDDELSDRRAKQARDNMTLVTGQPLRNEGLSSEQFFVLGEVGKGTLDAVAEAATKAWAEIKPWTMQDAVRGRITIFVLSKRYDYSEFAKMVEQRSIPSDWQSHWTYDGIDAYIAMVATSDDKDAALKARLVAPLASLSVAMRAPAVPRWFAEGVGRSVAAKTVQKDLPAVEGWNRELPAAIAAMADGNQLVKNELPPEQSDLIGYGVLSALLSPSGRRQYNQLLQAMPKSPTFEAAFVQTMGLKPADYVTRLKQMGGGGTGRAR